MIKVFIVFIIKTYPTSLSSIAPGWKGGKLPPLGGSLGEYSLNDFDEQPVSKPVAKEGEEEGWGGGGGGQRIKGDLDYFGFSPFKSHTHLSNLMLDDLVEICPNKSRLTTQFPAAFIP